MLRIPLMLVVLFSLSLAGTSSATGGTPSWTAWRGMDGSGVTHAGAPPTEWSETKNIKWKTALPGEGQSTPIVWENRIFLLTAIPVGQEIGKAKPAFGAFGPASKKVTATYRFIVLCLDRLTGALQWERQLTEVKPHEGYNPTGSLAPYSPITDGNHLWVNFGSRGVYCLTLDGDVVWSVAVDPLKMAGSFGEGSSPVLAGDLLIVLADHEGQSHITAYNKATGDVVWRENRDEKSSWSSPVLTTFEGRNEVITSASNAIRSYAPETGTLLWQCEGLTDCAAPTPVVYDGKVFCTTGFRGSSTMAIALGGTGDLTDSDAVRWKNKRVGSNVPSPIVYQDRLYVLRGYSSDLYCFNATTGESLYSRERIDGIKQIYASPLAVNGFLYFPGREGATAVLRAADTFEVVSVNTLNEIFDASPVAIGDELLLRGRRHLYCIAEPGKDGAAAG